MEISLLLVARNEEQYIGGLLETVKGYVDEIVVIDGESTDNTRDIALKYGAHIFSRPPQGYPEIDREFGISKCSYGMVLLLDADERPNTMILELLSRIRHDELIMSDGYSFPRRTYYDEQHSRYTKHYSYPDYQMRLFIKGAVSNYGGIHRPLTIKGCVAELEDMYYIIHLAPGKFYLRNMKWVHQGIRAGVPQGVLYHLVRIAYLPIMDFLHIFDWGRDGIPGIIGTLLAMKSDFLIQAGLLKRSLLNR